MKIIIALFLTIILCLIALSPVNAQSFLPWPVDKVVGEAAPDFTLKNMTNKEITLSSFKGSPILLNFWATWCPYCRQERPHLKALHEKYKDKDLVIISVSIDKSSKTVMNYMLQNPAPFMVLTDPEGYAAVPYNVMSLPTTFLITRDFKINRKFMGMVEWSDTKTKEFLDTLIEQKEAVK